jgi:hypothetical protein
MLKSQLEKALLFVTTGLFLSTAHAVRRSWTKEEDAELIRLVGVFGGRNWAAIAEGIPDRTDK